MTDTTELFRLPVLEGGTAREPLPEKRRRQQDRPARSYYDVPLLKPSLWRWEIASYFFLGGLSAGAFTLARVADRFGGEHYREVTKVGTAVAFSAFLPCAPLLIKDLGDPTRFHYMLRVFKPKSPMNLGAWVLSAFGGILSLAALNEWWKGRRRGRPGGVAKTADAAVGVLSDLAGVPLALLLAGYTGVLLSTTSTPIWARNRWIGPMFSAGAIGTGAAAIQLALTARERRADRRAHRALGHISTAAKVVEAVSLGGFLAEAGGLAKPLTSGEYAPHLLGGAIGVGLALSTVLEALPVKNEKTRRKLQIAGAIAGLVGGLALRWAMTQAGRPSGGDPQAAREASRSSAE